MASNLHTKETLPYAYGEIVGQEVLDVLNKPLQCGLGKVSALSKKSWAFPLEQQAVKY